MSAGSQRCVIRVRTILWGLTIYVAKATCFILFGMMQSAGPVDRNVAFATIQSCRAFHAAAGTDATELEQSIKHRAVITDVMLVLLLGKVIHVVEGHPFKKVDILIGVELCHLELRCWLRTKYFHLPV